MCVTDTGRRTWQQMMQRSQTVSEDMEGTGLQKEKTTTKKRKKTPNKSWKIRFNPQGVGTGAERRRRGGGGAREMACIRGEGVRRMDRSREGRERPSGDLELGTGS